MHLCTTIRDKIARQLVVEHEVTRQALRTLVRNPSLDLDLRMRAQLALNSFPRYTRPSVVSNRCTESGKGRGIITDHKLSRIVFRDRALAGELPGVKKSVF
ncbi:uncharacterized protein BJ171DRAFT_500105 [Polychytrium aggregatum]|uniref:uncharacterized protein n=1 Tax=Polychytrium aggregatum TaxID=110093 RepID=UPI0022FDDE68|nr:uncharacterized protein BJ171DRAFT_500105 [Polychytrium aggregatum]KAI9205910.1 hypothetical protein BJ171DRAFT_500105 [Polychytrium aggregatum]